MDTSTELYELIEQGKLEGFSGMPKPVITVISNVYIFNDKVLKIYKRDNEWWNKVMQDLSKGQPRINFITRDFKFNQKLNPAVYTDLKVLIKEGDKAILREPNDGDDELVVVMKKIDATQTMTKMLSEQKLSLDEYEKVGRDFTTKKLSLSKDFLPIELTTNWHEQLIGRFNDLEGWVYGEHDFPKEVADVGMAKLRNVLENQKDKFNAMSAADLAVCIDCNSENLLYLNGALSFMDVYPPKNEWRSAAFDHDIFRLGSDVCGFAGKEAYEAYLKGVYGVAENMLDKDLHAFYLLYGAMITGPYLYMLANKDPKYLPFAIKYCDYIKSIL